MDTPVNIHHGLERPEGIEADDMALVRGDYRYYHYGCDSLDDRGWGCGYRTLQTLCSWVRHQLGTLHPDTLPCDVPSLPRIQEVLVEIGDKPPTHRGSRDWIGSIEVGLAIDTLYDVPCKIIHVDSGKNLETHLVELRDHFNTKGAPVMMGGDSDSASKGILGVCGTGRNSSLLILDPHYYGPRPSQKMLIDCEMLLWRPVDSFMDTSFYNLCLPQLKLSGSK